MGAEGARGGSSVPPWTPVMPGAPCSCIRCGYRLDGVHASAPCPECGTPAVDSRDAWREIGGEPVALAVFARRIRAIATLVVFLALGWSFEWIVELTPPTVTFPGLGLTMALTDALNHPFFIAASAGALLWLGQEVAASPWGPRRARRLAIISAAAMSAAAMIACARLLASPWFDRILALLPDPERADWIIFLLVVVGYSPLALACAALRSRPPSRLPHWRHRTRLISLAAFLVIAVTAAILGAFVALNVAMRTPAGGVVQPVPPPSSVRLMIEVVQWLSMVAMPAALLFFAVVLLAALGGSARDAVGGASIRAALLSRRARRVLILGAIAVALVMPGTLVQRIIDFSRWGNPESSFLAAVGTVLVDGAPRTQLWILAWVAAVAFLWALAVVIPSIVMRRTTRTIERPG